MSNTEDSLMPSEGIANLPSRIELTKCKSVKRNGVAIDPEIALEELRKVIDAKVEGCYELVFEFENHSIVQRWRLRDGKWQLLDCLYEGASEQIVFMKNGKQLNAADDLDFLKLFGLGGEA
jgi:hypothetical protein